MLRLTTFKRNLIKSFSRMTFKQIYLKVHEKVDKKFEEQFGFAMKDVTFLKVVDYLHLPKDSSSLAFTRILFGLAMVFDIPDERGGALLEKRWGNPRTCRFPLFPFITAASLPVMAAVYAALWIGAVGIMLGYQYRCTSILFTVCHWYLLLIEKSYWNNHSYLFGLFAMLLSFTQANYYWSLDVFLDPKMKRYTVPYWNYFLLKYQFFILYFMAGLKKGTAEWLTGYSVKKLSEHWVFGPFKLFMNVPEIDYYIVHWFIFVFDLTIAVWMMWFKTRHVAMVFCALFNLMNSRLFRIGMFPWVCLATMPLFYPFDWPKRVIKLFLKYYHYCCSDKLKTMQLYDHKKLFSSNKHKIHNLNDNLDENEYSETIYYESDERKEDITRAEYEIGETQDETTHINNKCDESKDDMTHVDHKSGEIRTENEHFDHKSGKIKDDFTHNYENIDINNDYQNFGENHQSLDDYNEKRDGNDDENNILAENNEEGNIKSEDDLLKALNAKCNELKAKHKELIWLLRENFANEYSDDDNAVKEVLKCKKCFKTSKQRLKERDTKQEDEYKKKLRTCLIIFYMFLQLFLPYSHFITKGYNNWTNGLYGYSWDMMVHTWDTQSVVVKFVDNNNSKQYFLDPYMYAPNDRWTRHGDMLYQYAYCLKNNIIREAKENKITLSNNISIYVEVWCSLNGRFTQRLFDSKVDLLKATWSPFKRIPFLIPLLDEALGWRTKLDSIREHVMSWSNHSEVIFFADLPKYTLDKFISPELQNVNLTILKGPVALETDVDPNRIAQSFVLDTGRTFRLQPGYFYKVLNIGNDPAYYMYTFENVTEITSNHTQEENPKLPILKEFYFRLSNMGVFAKLVLKHIFSPCVWLGNYGL